MEDFSGSIFIRHHNVVHEQGYVVDGHCHNFDHTTFFWGVWQVEKYGLLVNIDTKAPILDEKGQQTWLKTETVTINGDAPKSWFLINAECRHRLTLLSPTGKFCCVYSHRKHNGEVVPFPTYWMAAYG